MTKRIIIIILLFCLCLGVSLYSAYHVDEVTKHMCSSVDKAFEALAQNDEEAIRSHVNEISSYWDSEEERLLHLIRHAAIDEITKCVARLEALAITGDYSELAAELASIRWQIDHVNRSERMVLQNLL